MLKLLYVDDDDDLRELASHCLALDPDIEANTAGSGAEALRLVAKTPFDGVLLDVMMPEMDGPGVLAAMRQRATGAPPVIFVTARALPAERQRLLDLGAAGVIIKPFDPMSFAADVRKILATCMTADPLKAPRLRFRTRCSADLDALRAVLADPTGLTDSAFATAMHQLSGTAGSFGYHELSRLAAKVDDELTQAQALTLENLQRLERELRSVALPTASDAD